MYTQSKDEDGVLEKYVTDKRRSLSRSLSLRDMKQKVVKKDRYGIQTTNRCISMTGPTAKKILLTKETNVVGGAVTLDYFEFQFEGKRKKSLRL